MSGRGLEMKIEKIKENILFYAGRMLKRNNLIKTVECVSVAMAACSLVIVSALIVNAPAQAENGQGGFETPGMPVVTDNTAQAHQSQDDSDIPELYYKSYRVRKGDIIGNIAEQFDITSDTIISVNNVRSSRTMQIGTYLRIPSIAGIMYTVRNDGETIGSIAKKYEVEPAKIAALNNVEESAVLKAGYMLFVPDAELDRITRQEINGDLFKKPIHARWYMSSSFGWRKSPFSGVRSYHGGIDMACPQGTSIWAAMPGKVTATGYNNTYGNFVIIEHHSGYKTLYGHMSQILAVKGQWVDLNTRIGRVGSTGLSTGPHLHFTVFKNGRQVNPANLWN